MNDARCWVALLLATTVAGAAAPEPRQLVRLDLQADDASVVRELGLDVAGVRRGEWVDVLVTADDLDRIRQRGVPAVVLDPDPRQTFRSGIGADDDLGAYHTYDEMLAELEALATLHPDIVRLHDIGDTWEKVNGLADRDIWAVKISDDPDFEDPTESDVLIVGTTHAREIVTVEVALAVASFLADGYGSDRRADFLVDHRETWIVPMLNPDGHDFVVNEDSLWRKNRNTNGETSTFRQGVDLNRNYGFEWGFDNVGSSPQKWSDTYRGTGPFSEPETQAIRDLAESHDFAISLSYHSYGDLFLFPWGYFDGDTEDHDVFVGLSDIYTQDNDYRAGNPRSGAIYNTNGSMDDWAYGEQVTKKRTFGFTPEIGSQFQPPESQIQPLIDENLEPTLMLIYFAQFTESRR